MTGKEKCKVLKTIRKDIAKANDIKLDIPECTHKGECRGTCPRCEAEVKALEGALASRRKRGLKIAVAGISAGLIALNTTSCDILDEISNRINGEELMGDMPYIEQSDGLLEPPNSDTTDTKSSDTEELYLDGDIAEPMGALVADDEFVEGEE